MTAAQTTAKHKLLLTSIFLFIPLVFGACDNNVLRPVNSGNSEPLPFEGNPVLPDEGSTQNGDQEGSTGVVTEDSLVLGTHGAYTDLYVSNWAELDFANVTAKQDLSRFEFETVVGEDIQVVCGPTTCGDEYTLSGKAWKVDWGSTSPDFWKTTAIHVRNVSRVVIEDVAIIQEDFYVGSDTIRIQGCDEAIIRNVYIEGSVDSAHIRVDGCKKVTIENVEIAGKDYNTDGDPATEQYSLGHGISVDNGTPSMAEQIEARDLEWLTIQNIYIHDYTYNPSGYNHDGIGSNAPSDGIMFNVYVENFTAADGAFDIGHRRTDDNYHNKLFRIERAIIDDCNLVKFTGESHADNAIIYTNSIQRNAFMGDYHNSYDIYVFNNTFHYDDSYGKSAFYKQWGLAAGRIYFANNLVYSSGTKYTNYNLHKLYYESGDATEGSYLTKIIPDHMVYVLKIDDAETLPWWLSGGVSDRIETFEVWQEQGKDKNSVALETADCFTSLQSSFESSDYSLLSSCPSVGFGNPQHLQFFEHPGMLIDKDIAGKPRSQTAPSAGAYEF